MLLLWIILFLCFPGADESFADFSAFSGAKPQPNPLAIPMQNVSAQSMPTQSKYLNYIYRKRVRQDNVMQ